jgi:recombination protein RecR
MTTNPLERVTQLLGKLPGVGQKSAMRLAIHLLRATDGLAQDLAHSLLHMKETVVLCPTCCALKEGSGDCHYCAHPKRLKHVICVVEDISDMLAIERSQPVHWSFHILHGVLSPLDGISPNDLKIRELLQRLRETTVTEVILATNASVEGEATASYLAKTLAPLGVRITRIAQGIPLGSQLEYVDQATLGRALEQRHEIQAQAGHVPHQPL